MKFPKKIVLTFLFALLLLTSACGSQPSASPLTGALSELSGTVNGKKSDETEFHAIAAGDILQVKDQVQTGLDGRARIDLSSGTIIRVVPSSLFTLTSNEPADGGLATKLKLELGRIFIILNGGTLEVETPSGVASVRGSYMMVEVDPVTHDVIVTCLEGNCSAGGINFSDGQKVIFHYDPDTGQYRPPLLEDMNDEDFQKWLDENPEARQIVDQMLAARPLATATLTAVPPTATSTQSSSSTVAENTCFNLLAPPNGAALTSGLVTFSWEPQAGAQNYRLVFTSPGGASNVLMSTGPSLTNYIDIFPSGGLYTWEVTALNASGGLICTANAFSFTKPISPTLVPIKPTQEKEACSIYNWQDKNPNAPCYCDPDAYTSNPPYCYGGNY